MFNSLRVSRPYRKFILIKREFQSHKLARSNTAAKLEQPQNLKNISS